MNYAKIKRLDVANGPGIRVSLFVSGCSHHCKGCFNPETWDEAYGQPYTVATEETILEFLKPNYVSGLTLLGGEPMEPEHQKALLPLLREVKQQYPEKSIWLYTGYRLDDEILKYMYTNNSNTREILSLIDVMVDGRFIEEQKNLKLYFRGSENQRIIDIKQTLASGKIVNVAAFSIDTENGGR